jgi:hypothetical protein
MESHAPALGGRSRVSNLEGLMRKKFPKRGEIPRRITFNLPHPMKIALFALLIGIIGPCQAQDKHIGVGSQPAEGAEVLINGTRAMLDAKWKYWEGPGFQSAMPIKWKVVPDPVDTDKGTTIMTDDRAADGGK